MTHNDEMGPGRWSFLITFLAALLYITAVFLATPAGVAATAAAGWGLITLVLLGVFISSVIGAYYSGKRNR